MSLIHLEDVKKSYSNIGMVTQVLKGVTLKISEGEYVAIIGPSGAGKSTLMAIMGCLGRPTSGSYYLDGEPVDRMNDKQLSRIRNEKIGFVFQAFHLLAGVSAFDNVYLPLVYCQTPPADARIRVREILEKVGLGERMSHSPGKLSGGEQQRVTIARALINQPKIILADEPTGNLDSKNGAEIMEIFDRLNAEGNTIILITHDPKVAARAHRTIHIIDGLIEKDEINENFPEPDPGAERTRA